MADPVRSQGGGQTLKLYIFAMCCRRRNVRNHIFGECMTRLPLNPPLAGVTDLLDGAAAGAERDGEHHRLAAVTHVETGLRVAGGVHAALEAPTETERHLHVVLAALH